MSENQHEGHTLSYMEESARAWHCEVVDELTLVFYENSEELIDVSQRSLWCDTCDREIEAHEIGLAPTWYAKDV